MRNWKYLIFLSAAAAPLYAQVPQPAIVTRTVSSPDATYIQVDRAGYATTFLTGVASNGRIVGFASNDLAVNSTSSQYLRSTGFMLWDSKTTEIVQPDSLNPPGRLSTFPLKIRVNGVVTGWSAPDQEVSAAERGWVWTHGRFQDVQYTGPEYSGLDPSIAYWKITDVMSINGRGDMIGQVGYINPDDRTIFGSHWRGWLYRAGVFQLIDPPGATLTYPSDINERGEIVGLYRTPSFRRGFLRSPDGRLSDIVVPASVSGAAAFLTFPQAINSAGEIVGFYALVPGYPRGFLFRRGAYSLIDFPGSTDTVVYGIDETGTMVGTFKDGSGVHGFIRIPKR